MFPMLFLAESGRAALQIKVAAGAVTAGRGAG